MENKEQLNQIPEESKNETRDEKTSNQETNQIEASQQSEEKPADEQPVTKAVDEAKSPSEEESEGQEASMEAAFIEEKETSTDETAEEDITQIEASVENDTDGKAEKAEIETSNEETVEVKTDEPTLEKSGEVTISPSDEDPKEQEAPIEAALIEEKEKPTTDETVEAEVEEIETSVENDTDGKAEKAEIETSNEEAIEVTTDEPTLAKSGEATVSTSDEKPEEQEAPIEAALIEEKEKAATEETVEAVVEEEASEKKEDEPASKKPKVEIPTEEKVEAKVGEEESAIVEENPVEEAADKTKIEEVALEKPLETPTEGSAKEETKEESVVQEKSETIVDAEEADEQEDEHEDEEHEEDGQKVDYNELSREELAEALEKLVQSDDVNKIKAKIALIKVAFLKRTKVEKEERYQHFLSEGGDKEDYHPADDPLEEKFNQLFGIYKQKRSIFLENLEKEKLENLEKKKAILEELKELIGSEETLKKTYDDFKTLQERWREVGMVPKNEVNNLWQNYHFLVEMFFDKVKINKELKDLDLKKNLEQKIVLCEKAEELLLETSILKSFKELQRLHEKWKEIGPVPDDKREEIWDRFKSATEKINLRRRDHYKKLQEQQKGNLVAKTALCEKAENLLTEESNSIKEWQNMTRQFNELFKVWKTIGPAPKKQNDEIWERFKSSLDAFFSEKKEYFAKLKDQQVNNYNIKLDLCVQAEALKDSSEWRNTTRDLINLQKQWKEVGPVPRKHSDKIWKRFRNACDEFFNRKAEHFSNIKEEEGANLKKKEELIKEVESYNFEGGNYRWVVE